MEGPAFPPPPPPPALSRTCTRAWGGDIIGMTALPEAKLGPRSRDLATRPWRGVTDYDCWHPDHDDVTVEMVVENLVANVANSRIILRHIMPELAALGPCDCHTALANAIITDRRMIPSEVRRRLYPIAGEHLDPPPN